MFLLVSSGALAVDRSVDELAEAAAEAEAGLDYELAGELWMEVILHPEVSEAQRFLGHLRSGIVQRVQSNNVEARIHFLYVLQHEPAFELGPEHAPKIRNFFELVRQEVRSGAETRGSSSAAPAPALAAPVPVDEGQGFPWLMAAGGGGVVVGVVVGVLGAMPLIEGTAAASDGAAAQSLVDYQAAQERYDGAKALEPLGAAGMVTGGVLVAAGVGALVMGAVE
jgi:hypothetical protein